MRLLLFLTAFYLSSYCCAQLTGKTWIISNSSNALILSDNNTFIIDDGVYYKKPQTYLLDGDTITFIEKELFSNLNDIEIFKQRQHKYYLLSETKDSLILIRCNETNYLGYNRDTVTLRDYQSLYDPTFSFRHIYFAATSCYGFCPDFKMEILSNGVVYFYGRLYTGRYKGTWKGHLSDKQMSRLLAILRNSNIRNFPSGTGIPIDAPERRLIIKYGDHELDFCGSDFPYTGHKLMAFLFTEYKNFRLKRCTGCRAFIEKSCFEIMREEHETFMKEFIDTNIE